MQTFLPFESFTVTAKCLDYKRLGKQRVEAKQLVQILQDDSFVSLWRKHPACQMWRGHTLALATYGLIMCEEWKRRGYVDNTGPFFLKVLEDAPNEKVILPWWVGYNDFHRSHRSNLVRKDPEYYRPFFPDVPPNLPYFWPIM